MVSVVKARYGGGDALVEAEGGEVLDGDEVFFGGAEEAETDGGFGEAALEFAHEAALGLGDEVGVLGGGDGAGAFFLVEF